MVIYRAQFLYAYKGGGYPGYGYSTKVVGYFKTKEKAERKLKDAIDNLDHTKMHYQYPEVYEIVVE